MSAFTTILVALVAVLLYVVLALGLRLWRLHRGGTAAIMRDLPASGSHGWRHGVMRYEGAEASFYRLSSARLWPDRRISRRGAEITARREPTAAELDFMADGLVVVELADSAQRRRARFDVARFEVAMEIGSHAAFLSWLESRPSPRARKRSV